MRILFLDCISGISGDMTVGALIDLGVKPSALEWELSKLDLGDFHMHFDRQKRQSIEGVKFGIHEGATHTHEQDDHPGCGSEHSHAHGEHGHSHTSEHRQAHDEEACGHEHEHGHAHGHHHQEEDQKNEDQDDEHEDEPLPSHSHKNNEGDHGHGSEPGAHQHEHAPEHGHHHDGQHAHHLGHEHIHGRTHGEIRVLIEQSELSPFVKKHALGIFQRIAVAEGKIHGQPSEDVGFHEVGALDSIADIVCTCVGIEALGVEKVFVSSLQEGRGTIHCAHGTFPLPAPATLEILMGIPLSQLDEPNELITPTGAAIAAEFGASFGPMPKLKTEKIGYGIGTRELASRPNVLRAVLGELVAD